MQLPPTFWGKSAGFQKQTNQNPQGFDLFVLPSKAIRALEATPGTDCSKSANIGRAYLTSGWTVVVGVGLVIVASTTVPGGIGTPEAVGRGVGQMLQGVEVGPIVCVGEGVTGVAVRTAVFVGAGTVLVASTGVAAGQTPLSR